MDKSDDCFDFNLCCQEYDIRPEVYESILKLEANYKQVYIQNEILKKKVEFLREQRDGLVYKLINYWPYAGGYALTPEDYEKQFKKEFGEL